METSSTDQIIQSQLNKLPDLSTCAISADISQVDESENEDEYILTSDRENQGRFAELLHVIREFFRPHTCLWPNSLWKTHQNLLGENAYHFLLLFLIFLSRYLLIA